ncbi:MAG: hypothetical protein WKF96_24030, partial [Solirubrobacteraceae bacterium]
WLWSRWSRVRVPSLTLAKSLLTRGFVVKWCAPRSRTVHQSSTNHTTTMATPEEIRAELRDEERDEPQGAAPVYHVMRGDYLVGYVFLDEREQWRYGPSRDESTVLTGVPPGRVVEVALDRMAAELADEHDD